MLENLFWKDKIASEMKKLTNTKVSNTLVDTLYKNLDKIDLNSLLVTDSYTLLSNLKKQSLILSNVTGIDPEICRIFLLVFSDYYKKGLISKEIFFKEEKNLILNITTEIKTYFNYLIILFILIIIISFLTRRK